MQEYTTMVKTEVLERDLFIDGQKILTYSIAYPVLSGSRYQMALPGINRFYREKAEAYQDYVEKELLPKAEEQYRYSVWFLTSMSSPAARTAIHSAALRSGICRASG